MTCRDGGQPGRRAGLRTALAGVLFH